MSEKNFLIKITTFLVAGLSSVRPRDNRVIHDQVNMGTDVDVNAEGKMADYNEDDDRLDRRIQHDVDLNQALDGIVE